MKNAKEDIHYEEVLYVGRNKRCNKYPPVTNEGTAKEIVDNSIGEL
nr:hypothetical protein [Staphylococcus epidermidis]